MLNHESIFNEENSGLPFAKYRLVSENSANRIALNLFSNLGILKDNSIRKSLKYSYDNSKELLIEFLGTAGELEIILINSISYRPEVIFINYNLFEKIYEISLSDFIKYFDHIWYPGADDIDIFDETRDWIFHITHEQELKIYKI